tara:strand:+ start:1345 stop:4035 length:2691 start_codon:yes stop_codon:yes gene_type:complete
MAEKQIVFGPNDEEIEFPANMSMQEIESVMQKQFGTQEADPEKIGRTSSFVKGVNTNLLADMGGLAVDIMNNVPKIVVGAAKQLFPKTIFPKTYKEDIKDIQTKTLTEMLGGTPDAIGGSRSIRKGLAATNLGYENLSDLAPSERPYAVAGEVIGGSLPFFLAPLRAAAALKQGETAKGIFAPIVQAAKETPKRFIGVEAGLSGLSAGGAATAEVLAPGNPTARMIGELAGPNLPIVTAARYLPSALRQATTAVKSVIPGDKFLKSEAAQVVQSKVTDPEKVAVALDEPVSKTLTSGQLTGDPNLLAIENKLIESSQRVKGRAGEQIKSSYKDFNKKYNQIIETGDVDSIKEAAQIKLNIVNKTLDDQVEQAKNLVESKANRTFTTDLDRENINKRARQILLQANDDARKTETQLWNKIDKDIKITATNLEDTIKAQKNNLLEGQNLDNVFEAYLKKLDKNKELSVGELNKIRSRALEINRDLSFQGNFSKARPYKNLAQAALKDLEKVDGLANKSVETWGSLARKYSRRYNEVFQRPVVKNILQRGPKGAREELTFDAALAPKVKGKINLRDLREAAGLPVTNTSISSKRATEIESLQNDLLRILAGETSNFDNSINVNNLQRFINRYEPALKEANLYDTLTDLNQNQRAASELIKTTDKTKAAFAKNMTSKVLGGNINTIIENVLKSPTPTGALQELVKVTSNRGRQGLQYTIMQSLLKLGTVSRGNEFIISGTRLNQILNKPTETGISLGETLVNTGALNTNQKNNLDELVNKSTIFENAVINKSNLDDLLGAESAVFNLFQRVLGSNIGAAGAVGSVSGSPLVAAAAGSKATQAILGKMPRAKVQQILVEAMFNPELMQELLRKPITPKQVFQQRKQINAYLLAAGIPELEE